MARAAASCRYMSEYHGSVLMMLDIFIANVITHGYRNQKRKTGSGNAFLEEQRESKAPCPRGLGHLSAFGDYLRRPQNLGFDNGDRALIPRLLAQ